MGALEHAIPKRQGLCVVPTEATAAEFRRHMLAASPALLGDVFLSWPRFIDKLSSPTRPVLSGMQVTLFIFKLLTSHPLRYFRRKRPSIGIARQFADTILSLKKNGISPARLEKILETRGSLKENDLLTLFVRYEEERRRKRLPDQGDLNALAIDNIKRGKTHLLSGIETIIFDEFHRFMPGQIALIKVIKKAIPRAEIQISFPTARDGEARYASHLKKGFKKIEKLADKIVELEARDGASPEISVATTRSPFQEARAAARMIAEDFTLRDPDSIVLATRNDTHFTEDFLIEAESSGLLVEKPNRPQPMSTPFLNQILSPASTENWPDEATIDEYADRCISFVRSQDVASSWTKELHRDPKRRSQTNRSLAGIAGLENTLNALSITSELLGIPPIKRESFILLVTTEFASSAYTAALSDRMLPFRTIAFDAGLALPAKHVLIPNMIEGNMPRIQSDRLFFSEADKLCPEPDPTIDEIFPNAESSLASESYTFDTFLSKCSERLALTYPVIDESGAEVSPSAFLDPFPKATPLEPYAPLPAAAASRYWEERARHIIEIEDERASGMPTHEAYHGILSSDDAICTVRNRFSNEPLSPTRLQKYAECPFAFFVDKVLGLKASDEEMPEMLPKDRGTIVHVLLEKFYADHVDDFKKAIANDEYEARLKSIIDDLLKVVLEENAALVGKMADGLRPFQYRAIETMAWQAIKVELDQARGLSAPLYPVACEWSFGKAPENTLAIPIEGEKDAGIEGRIDRIDADSEQGRFIVVDYKSGRSVESVRSAILKGMHLQLPLYVMAVKRFLMPDAAALGGLLLAIQLAEKRHGFVLKEFNEVNYSVGRSKSAMSEGDWNEAMETAAKAAAGYVSSIRKGRFEVRPRDGCPRGCDYEDVCRYCG